MTLRHLRQMDYTQPLRDLWKNLVYYWYLYPRHYGALVIALATLIALLGFAIDRSVQASAQTQELTCLALNVYHEARGEPLEGQYAVAQVTMNRVMSRHYPKTICGVVYQKNWDWIRGREVAAFSWTLHDEIPIPEPMAWQQAWQVAEDVYSQPNKYHRILGKALFYHAREVEPRWAQEKREIATIGDHVFYQ